jgi:polygalacturonase
VSGGEIRNLQITGNDIEYNNNRSIGVPGAESEPTAEIFIDCRDGSVREGTIASNTIQATASPGGANIRFLGAGAGDERRTGMWTITGNLIGSQSVNIHLVGALGFAISGNYLYSGHERTILVERSRSIALGSNCIGHNPDYGDKELSPGIRFEDCRDSSLTGLVIQDAVAGRNTVAEAPPTRKEALVELVRCHRMTVCGCQILEGTPVGLLIDDCRDTLVSGCTILDGRPRPLMRTAIEWRSTRAADAPPDSAVLGCRLQDLSLPPSVKVADNLLGPSVP